MSGILFCQNSAWIVGLSIKLEMLVKERESEMRVC